MSTLELVAVALGLANLSLLIRRSVWNYPFGIAMVSLYAVIFFDAKLYSETALQVFFVGIQIYGWARWREVQQETGDIAVSWSSAGLAAIWLIATLAAALGLGALMERFTDAAAPYPDAFITAASVSAQILLVLRRVESWIYWVVIDVVAIWLFYTRELEATSGLYVVFLIMASVGLWQWVQSARVSVESGPEPLADGAA
ncbi:MAG: nicotinamide mononucleotide transporter [Erythrobacter sp.]|nr:nicotinamide mononucleotide transporter [Erythrobacter sp.]